MMCSEVDGRCICVLLQPGYIEQFVRKLLGDRARVQKSRPALQRKPRGAMELAHREDRHRARSAEMAAFG